MEYRFLGRSGLQVSTLSFGAWVTFGDQVGEDVAFDLMKTAVDAGIISRPDGAVCEGGRRRLSPGPPS
jgi:predicted aldo/keto reductase-like oxidoreductase